MKLTEKHTVGAACVGYLTQALTINFAPLLFITFQNEFGISLGKISLLIGISFFTQLLTDTFIAKFNDRLNPRAFAIGAHICSVLGMIGLSILPEIMPTAFLGLVLCTVISAIGGAIVEVLISPIVEACPTKNKSSTMIFLHSFYCWGTAGVVILSTLFFGAFGIDHWRILACLWAIIPSFGAIAFIFVPLYPLNTDKDQFDSTKRSSCLRKGIFWVLFIMMFCAGAAEQTIGQWASTFAESGLGISKAAGDVFCPCAFALCMGIARVVYSKNGNKIRLDVFVFVSAFVCVIAYILTAVSSRPIISLIGCALCGLSVGIMWPGTYSLATQHMAGSVQMFALLAIAGDIGSLAGPTAAGWIAENFGNDLRISFLLASVFPLIILILMKYILQKSRNKA